MFTVERGIQDTNTKMSSGRIFLSAKGKQSIELEFENKGTQKIVLYEETTDKKITQQLWTEQKINAFYSVRRESIFSRYIDICCLKKPDKPDSSITKIDGVKVDLSPGHSRCIDLLNFEFVKVYLEFDDPMVNCIEYSYLDVVNKSFCVSMERFGECTFCIIEFDQVVTPAKPFYIKFLDEQGRLIPLEKFWLYNSLDTQEMSLIND